MSTSHSFGEHKGGCMVFIEKNEDPNVDIEILDGDKSQVGLGFEANDHIANLENKYEWFANGVDCYRAAVAVALARGKDKSDLGSLTGKKNKYSVGTIDGDGRLRELIVTFRPDLSDKPYYASEWLAEIGLSIIREELDSGKFLSEILLGSEEMGENSV
jgi:hypothetical protein